MDIKIFKILRIPQGDEWYRIVKYEKVCWIPEDICIEIFKYLDIVRDYYLILRLNKLSYKIISNMLCNWMAFTAFNGECCEIKYIKIDKELHNSLKYILNPDGAIESNILMRLEVGMFYKPNRKLYDNCSIHSVMNFNDIDTKLKMIKHKDIIGTTRKCLDGLYNYEKFKNLCILVRDETIKQHYGENPPGNPIPVPDKFTQNHYSHGEANLDIILNDKK